ncbi:sensor histidine kinase [Qipengyuania atrilutea]|uniref:histidine kinase n=1 Tax=Qipengyuania atrilutea TaxID=2744473 RepID=A0A850GZ56_9SPHN|nr:HWE histidine kinase domain-containing protein [Actirhodobacter atriluteus]NVD44901.1 PAS domain-containing protein [Actirhodobacter atriluteus]
MSDILPFEEHSSEHLRLAVTAGLIGIWELDLGTGQAARSSQHDQIFGYETPVENWSYADFLNHVVDADRTRVDETQQRAVELRQDWVFECRIVRSDGKERWISAAGRPILGSQGTVERLIGHVVDITDSKRDEERLSLITQELNHRVRNMLAMIRSMIRLSASNANDLKAFARGLEGRVDALARTQDLLVSEPSLVLTPGEILRRELAAFEGLEERVTMTGADAAEIDASLAQGLALVFHELITNAQKYGALSNKDGTVTFAVTPDSDLTLVWKEHGGPAPREDVPSGFGAKLIRGAIGARARVEPSITPEGYECRIVLEPKP